MNKTIYADWNGHNMKLTWIPTDQQPEACKVTSVHGYCFHDDKVMLVHVAGRSFNMPGGHVEQGETPEQAFHREAMEEGSVEGDIHYLGMIEVSSEENPLYDPKGKYPLIGYQLFYRMDITKCHPFRREHETTARIWVEPSEVPYVIEDHALALLILEKASECVKT
ncbi:NUDIX domain-containing protein [Paenibacillus sp. N1-5-1-14]|uniref:NUDIX hydrolase n=1 Tax=Paenibacillus radicibacter TaxID=2972488 RepID=UPI00215915C7|nr:NUDIX domain-containing protein [Paenibacillus radicibacter]MCR8644477.1 NUDIX domain-containing protein [Paenibacillus radicibacter]